MVMTDVWDPQDHDESTPNGYRRPARVDLGDLVAGEHIQPAVHEHVVYARKLAALGGEPGHGKSTVLAWWLLKAAERGYPVALFDWEAGASHTSDLLHSFGADPAAIGKFFHYYPHPVLDWEGVAAEIREIKPVIAGFDSSIAILAAMGGNENSPTDVRRMWGSLAPLAHDLGCAVIVTDHSGKDAEQSRYNRGSTDKLAAVDVSMKLTATEQFSRTQDGKLRLTVMKDRPGWLHWHWDIRVTRDPLALAWRKGKPAHRAGAEMSEGKQEILDAVSPSPETWQEIVTRKVENTGRGMSRKWATTYLNELADTGHVERMDQGEGREVLWRRPRPRPEPGPEQGTLA